MNRSLAILLGCVFVVMIGFGLTLPVMPYLIEQLAVAEGAVASRASVHVGLLTAIFPLMQLFFAPLWGRWSDRIGRRPLILMGLTGYAVFLIVFGFGSSLTMLYAARVFGGIFSSAILPAATAYVVDSTSEATRGRGMGWLGGAVSLGVVVGPAIGGILSRDVGDVVTRFGFLAVRGFSPPFFVAAGLTLLTLLAAFLWLPESLRKREPAAALFSPGFRLRPLLRRVGVVLALSLLAQYGLTIFESTYALYASQVVNYGPSQMGIVFTVCGIVMSGVQGGVVGRLIDRMGERRVIAVGFALAGLGMWLLVTTVRPWLILVFVGVLALGIGLLSPSLATLVSKRSGTRPGTVLGLQSAALSLGQVGGPLLGGFLFAWHVHAPYWVTSVLLTGAAVGVESKMWRSENQGDGA
jgi:DHA1 family multidrug resistance protein-like MFS transporter